MCSAIAARSAGSRSAKLLRARVLLRLLPRPEAEVVEVLAPAGRVAALRLQLGAGRGEIQTSF
jgi:hypothetical protein